ncbi:YfcC family protein [Corynebacterium uberis]|uniref:YfcC family protein n=1 Tax=Corynebacterium TaxID=1716 RepID=UPI001D0A8135|nr:MULTISPECIES: YfcC family protein [Corynebacterium]MCZ9309771.1 YfcC family protein [Corynebacterium sp. c6VSa_13]UDL73573.1 YfcC family protein [Corynebacterium uberis]UDL75547.1 YfcC family protein [Corynebacterium uberis]UDL77760.1 YfcC family protein [Corynebacterium uberis]UDL80043.1 YfcC family protein [Corynebacterium uberis]
MTASQPDSLDAHAQDNTLIDAPPGGELPGSATDEAQKKPKKRKFSFPSAFTILFALTIVAVAATWFVPAGSYSKLHFDDSSSQLVVTAPDGSTENLPAEQSSLDKLNMDIGIDKFTSGAIKNEISVPGTYERVEQVRAGAWDIPTSMVEGTIEAVDIIVFILVLGGLIGVVRATGAFESGLMALTKKTKGREFMLVAVVSVLMVLGGTACGMEEEAVAFYPILAPIFISLGYDSIVTVGAIFLAGSVGSAFSTINPFSVVIASNAAGVQFTEGITWRIAGCAVGAVAIIAYLAWYCRRIKKDPSASISYEDRDKFKKHWGMSEDAAAIGAFTVEKKIILTLFAIAFPLMVWGVMSQGWWFPTMAASFLTITLIIMFIAHYGGSKLSESQVVDAFSEGASSLVAVSLIIGLARGINIVLNEGKISDTMLDSASHMVTGMHGPVFILMLMVVFFFLGFVVPSSSGLAVLSMPIMAPLADAVGIERFIVVSAYQWGQYAMLFIAPTGLIMATLQMLDMKFSHWLKFVWPMVAFMFVFGGGMLVAQVLVYS